MHCSVRFSPVLLVLWVWVLGGNTGWSDGIGSGSCGAARVDGAGERRNNRFAANGFSASRLTDVGKLLKLIAVEQRISVPQNSGLTVEGLRMQVAPCYED